MAVDDGAEEVVVDGLDVVETVVDTFDVVVGVVVLFIVVVGVTVVEGAVAVGAGAAPNASP